MKRRMTADIKKAAGLCVLWTVLVFWILLYSGCGTASQALSEEEIAGFNTEFFNDETDRMNNMLLCSEYDSPEEINLFELFYNGVYHGMSGGLAAGDVSEEELALLAEFDSEAPYLDVMKVTTDEMNAVLQEKLGISLEGTKKIGLENFYYLEEYDSYYLIHGDTNFDWCTVVLGTWEPGDRLTLEYTKEYAQGQWTVTLQKTDDGYLFVSNKKTD